MTETILDIKHIAKTYRVGFFRRAVHAVRNVSFQIERGEVLGIVGPNGAGKSTTIKMIAGLVRPDRGSISLFGEPVSKVDVRARMGFLPENPHLYEHLKALELLTFYGGLLGMSRRQARKRGTELLEQVGLGDALTRPISKFSKGMKQRAGIAQALLGDPEFLLLDEPHSGLDPIGRREVRDLIVDLRRQGKTILFCSHVLPDVEDICDRIVVIHQGEAVESGFIHELLDHRVLRYELFARNWSDSLTEQLADHIQDIFIVGELRRVVFSGETDMENVLQIVAEAGARIESLQPHRQHLEDIFIRDTAPKQVEGETS